MLPILYAWSSSSGRTLTVCATNRSQCCSSDDISRWITAAQIDLVSGLQMQFTQKAQVFDTLINDIIQCEWKNKSIHNPCWKNVWFYFCWWNLEYYIWKIWTTWNFWISNTHSDIPLLAILEFYAWVLSIWKFDHIQANTLDSAIAPTQFGTHPCVQAVLV